MYSVVWLRRDLRLTDHAALRAALKLEKPIVVLYIYVHGDLDYTIAQDHISFINECLADCEPKLAAFGLSITYRTVKHDMSVRKVSRRQNQSDAAVTLCLGLGGIKY